MNARTLGTMIVIAGGLGLFGCAGQIDGGELAIRSAARPAFVLRGQFTTAVYRYTDDNTLDVLLVEGPIEKPTQVVHLQMFWAPIAGRTPVDRRSTNASVRYLVFTGQAAGVYEGAGFLFPKSKVGQRVFRGELRHAALRLEDHTARFRDRLGAAEAGGSFTARRDNQATARLLRQLEKQLSRQLGYPRSVNRGSSEPSLSAARDSVSDR